MKKNKVNVLHILSFMIIILSVLVTATGLFYTSGGEPFDVINQYGGSVKMYGDGIYAHDSFFRVPIFKGTDFTILLVGVPMLAAATLLDLKRKTVKRRILLASMIALFLYYAANIAFGVTYNSLHLVYIALFSSELFALIIAMSGMDYSDVEKSITNVLPYKGIYAFLAVTGIALFIAWLPDIISALQASRPLAMIEVYTTEPTYVLDMGIISPLAFSCLYLLRKREGLGYMLLSILLIICMVMGVMLPVQMLFQVAAGIAIPLPVLITKIGIFVVLAVFAAYFEIRFMKVLQ
jgi:hypothetical protein